MSELMELFLSTFYLVCIIAFVHLCLDASLGLIVAFRRYCTASTYVTDLPNRWKHIRRRMKSYERPTDCSEDSDSDNTDIDAAVDEYKTELYVSTVMSWNGSEILHRRNPFRQENGAKTSARIKVLLSVVALLIGIISLSLRWIARMNPFSITISAVCFIAFLVILFVVWLHPQKMRARAPIFKVPCVPWIPAGSALFHCVLLFQLPAATWLSVSAWLTAGLIVYAFYGYGHSRLNFNNNSSSNSSDNNSSNNSTNSNNSGDSSSSSAVAIDTKIKVKSISQEPLLSIPQDLVNITSSSIAVYPQPYHQLA